MKILFIGARSYYGLSDSFEYLMESGSLTDMGHEVQFVSTELPGLIERTEKTAAAFNPDCIIFHPALNEMDMLRFAQLKAPKLVLLADDDWRRDYGLSLAPYTDFILANALDSAEAYGPKYVPFQWGVREKWYAVKNPDDERHINVSFIGMNYGYRGELVKRIEHAGIPVNTYGHGWQTKIPSADMPNIFWHSWISLNTSMSSTGEKLQIKARNFEVPASRALLLTEYAPGLEAYYTDGKEAIFWRALDECVDKVLYYLTHRDELATIAQAGYERTLREHTFAQRWAVVFKAAGLE